MTKIFTFIMIVCMAVIVGSVAEASNEPARYSVRITAEQDQVKMGDNIVLDIQLTNTSLESYDMAFGIPVSEKYRVFIEKENGDTPPKTQRELALESDPYGYMGDLGLEEFKPREIKRDHLVVNELFDINTPGLYLIRISQIASDGIHEPAISNLVRVTVKP